MTGKDKYVFSSREINLGPGSQISACQLSMEADKITVAEGATVDLSAACNMASGKGYSGGNAGGSHAGEGGVTTEASKAGETYGDFRRPTTAGSGGRLTQPGGALNIKGITVTIAGTLRANGEDASYHKDITTGGASGGSIAVTADVLEMSGSVHATGGSGSSYGGGGGGGLVMFKYKTGGVYGQAIAEGGSATDPTKTGAAGLVYQEVGQGYQAYRKLMVSQSLTTPQVTRLVVPNDEVLTDVDQVHLSGAPILAFIPRQDPAPSLTVRFGMVTGGGSLRIAYPAFSSSSVTSSTAGTVTLFSLKTRTGGVLKSNKCSASGTVNLVLTFINKTDDFSVPSGVSISSGANITYIEQRHNPLPNRTCELGNDLLLYKGQECELPAGEHVFKTVTLETGSSLILRGDTTGVLKTLVHAETFIMKRGAKVNGTGTGYLSGGRGQATSGTMGATYGGAGVGNPASVYGNIPLPRDYGSNGFQASLQNGRGGGQLELDISVKVHIDGVIDVSGSSGGSGGSLYIHAANLTGEGSMLARGGDAGGGGGRISVVVPVSGYYSFFGSYDTSGGQLSGIRAASGTVFIEKPDAAGQTSQTLLISGDGSLPVLLSNSIGIPNILTNLEMMNGAQARVADNLQVGTLSGDGTGTLIINDTSTLEINNFQDPVRGSQCSFYVGPNARLVHTDKDLIISGLRPVLDLEGHLIARSLRIGSAGSLFLKSHGLKVDSVLLSDQVKAMVTVKESDGSQSIMFSSLSLGYNATLNFAQSNVTVTATTLEMMPMSIMKTEANPAHLLLVVDALTVHDTAQITVAGQGLNNLTLNGGGGSHGGEGGSSNCNGCTYGSTTYPTDLGTGTSNSPGGGSVRLKVAGSLFLDGSITADGASTAVQVEVGAVEAASLLRQMQCQVMGL
ncbi:uncharacterized protein LOC112561608 [Pomacea canaliculata]|uniref:uncharacterized protein LOC112561608 n=1 Tax=Pomacea canaliculata TaxID=400727 RepID=UPI000D72BE72|nr:uncharacterized protein LOC112561608 [Pomacea canaliculata]